MICGTFAAGARVVFVTPQGMLFIAGNEDMGDEIGLVQNGAERMGENLLEFRQLRVRPRSDYQGGKLLICARELAVALLEPLIQVNDEICGKDKGAEK